MAAFNVLGSSAGSQEGQTIFYKSVSMPSLEVQGVLSLGLGANKKAITTLFDEKHLLQILLLLVLCWLKIL